MKAVKASSLYAKYKKLTDALVAAGKASSNYRRDRTMERKQSERITALTMRSVDLEMRRRNIFHERRKLTANDKRHVALDKEEDTLSKERRAISMKIAEIRRKMREPKQTLERKYKIINAGVEAALRRIELLNRKMTARFLNDEIKKAKDKSLLRIKLELEKIHKGYVKI